MEIFNGSGSILAMAFSSGLVVGGVLLSLVICSVFAWAVIIFKYRLIRAASKESSLFLDIFWESRNLKAVLGASEEMEQSPIAKLFNAGYREWMRTRRRRPAADEGDDDSLELGSIKSVERALRRTTDTEVARLERMLVFLATVASAAPFVGLFGTVWGIMNSFREIGVTGSANLAVVAPGISEALIATATGLAAAIPAVVAYNYFNNTISVLTTEMEAFNSEFLNIVSHHTAGEAGRKQ